MSSQPSSAPRINQPKQSSESGSVGEAVGRHGQSAAEHLVVTPTKDLLGQLQQYAREKPDIAACWCFALGVVVGWKLRS